VSRAVDRLAFQEWDLYGGPGCRVDKDPAKVGCRQCDKNAACETNTAAGIWDSISLRIEIIDQALSGKEGSFANILERMRLIAGK
jgi:hypothetical protein